jgi:hypothetical protein
MRRTHVHGNEGGICVGGAPRYPMLWGRGAGMWRPWAVRRGGRCDALAAGWLLHGCCGCE